MRNQDKTASHYGSYKVSEVITGPGQFYPLIWQWFYSMRVDPSLTSWPKYQVLTLHCFFTIQNFIFLFLDNYFISLVKGTNVWLITVTQLVARAPTVQVTKV